MAEKRYYTLEEAEFLHRMKKRLEKKPTRENPEIIIKQGKKVSEEETKTKPIKKTQPSKVQKPVKVKPKSIKRKFSKKLIKGVISAYRPTAKLSQSLLNIGGVVFPRRKISPRQVQNVQNRRLPPQYRNFENNAGERVFSKINYTPAQFQTLQAVGVWARNYDSPIGSKMPPSRIWMHRPIYGFEGDIMGKIQLKEFATEQAFFN